MKHVLIVGAGPAGLTAAYDLLSKGKHEYEVTVIEEQPRVGGISCTIDHNGNRIDLGGHRFFSKSPEVNDLWKEIMPLQGAPAWDDLRLGRTVPLSQGGPDPEVEERVMLTRHRVSRIYFLRKFFDYPISMRPETFINMGLLRTVKAGFGYLLSCIHKRPETSLEDFYINRFGRPLYQMFFEDYTEKVWGIHPSGISPDWGRQRVKELSLLKALLNAIKPKNSSESKSVETSLIEQFSYPKRGPGQLWECMADDIQKMGGTIRLNTHITSFARNTDGVITSATCRTSEGTTESIPCDAVFSSMPLKDLADAIPGLPEDVVSAARALPYRDFITVGLLVDRLLIKNETKIPTIGQIVPDCWIYIQERNVRIGRLQIFNNWSPYMNKDPEHTVWIGLEYFCNEGDSMWNMPDSDFISFARQELLSIGILDDIPVRDSVCIHVRKAYPAYFGSYAQIKQIQNMLNSIPNLYCIGRNGQHRYNNMDHSMLTGLCASRLYRENIHDRTELWNINTEEAYHEES
ncbi:MAG: NAD(P)/FAD-dependent oxidoreductase [Clostridia bacterium]|nr:NAD(P)/FAD-dependent oxidoreductase [Clostridia bacterium]